MEIKTVVIKLESNRIRFKLETSDDDVNINYQTAREFIKGGTPVKVKCSTGYEEVEVV